MNIKSLSYSHSVNDINNLSTQPVSFTAKNNLVDNSISDFLSVGGQLKYDKAFVDEKTMYTGNLLQDMTMYKLKSEYKNGEKQSIRFYINSGKSCPKTPFALLKPVETINNSDGSKEITWASDGQFINYTEKYDNNGKLVETKIERSKMTAEYYYPEYYSSYRKYCRMTKADGFLLEITTKYNNDGITPKHIEMKSYTDNSAYSDFDERKMFFTDEGILSKTYTKGLYDYLKTRRSDELLTIYDKKGEFQQSKETNIRYYPVSNKSDPMAKSSYIMTTLDEFGREVSKEYNYNVLNDKVDKLPLSSVAFKVKPNTIRVIKSNGIHYYDAVTRKKYAVEITDLNGNITKVSDLENKLTTVYSHRAFNVLAHQYNEEGKLVSKAGFIKPKDDYQIIQKEDYNPETGNISAIYTFADNNISRKSYYDENSNMYKREKFDEDGNVIASAKFENKKMIEQTINMRNGGKKVIEFLDNSVAIETVYSSSGNKKSETKYINKLAEEKKIYDEKGQVEKVVTYKNGIPLTEEDSGGKLTKLVPEDFD